MCRPPRSFATIDKKRFFYLEPHDATYARDRVPRVSRATIGGGRFFYAWNACRGCWELAEQPTRSFDRHDVARENKSGDGESFGTTLARRIFRRVSPSAHTSRCSRMQVYIYIYIAEPDSIELIIPSAWQSSFSSANRRNSPRQNVLSRDPPQLTRPRRI